MSALVACAGFLACVGDDPVSSTPIGGSDAGPDTSGPAADGGGGGGDAAVDAAEPRKRVFVTSTTTVALFSATGGITKADELCENLAGNAGLVGSFVAWLSDSSTHASDRLDDQPYYLVDGTTLVALGKSALTSGTLAAPINRDAKNNAVTGTVWTGTTAAGKRSNDVCVDWTAAGGAQTGTVGLATATDGKWTEHDGAACNSEHRLYCFEL
jgi:hypothetical protein